MIKNIWNTIHFYCGHNHSEPVEMIVQQGPHSPFFSCPRYYPENREPGERACANRLNFVDAELVINSLSKIIEDNEWNNVVADLTNLEFECKTIHVKVTRYSKQRIDLEILNRKALK